MSIATDELRSEETAELLACVPTDRFIPAREIWERLGKWALTTVKNKKLPELAVAGLVERRVEPGIGVTTVALYRRIAQ